MKQQCNAEALASLTQFFNEAEAIVEHHTAEYHAIKLLLTEAVLVVGTDKMKAYKLCEEAMDREHALGDCDPSARVAQALFGDWEPEEPALEGAES